MSVRVTGLACVAAWLVLLSSGGEPLRAQDRALQMYFVDVEGGQATLIVSPSGQTMLVDAGFPADGTFRSKAGDPARARDAQRIATAARAAGISRIDMLLVTHFHADHMGGVPELAALLPIETFIDHDRPLPEAEQTVGGTLAGFDAYAAVRASGQHLDPAPGSRLFLGGVTVTVLSGAGDVISRPLPRAAGPNAACSATALPAQEPNENPRSTGIVLEYGSFRFLDLGDLTGAPLFALACPDDRVGPVDVYLVAHHGGADAADPATFAAFRPRVAVLNNGERKGGAPETLATLHKAAGIEDIWQIHRSMADGAENSADNLIANLDETTAHWIRLAAQADGSFEIMNGRTGTTTRYPARQPDR